MADPEHPDLIVHVGLHKTGTTSLQELLGWLGNVWEGTYLGRPYNGARDDTSGARAAMAAFLEREGARTELLTELVATHRARGHVSLSEEMLTPAPWNHTGRSARYSAAVIDSADLDDLIERVGALDPTRIVLTTRHPQPFLRSHYLYAVHLGYRHGYHRFLTETLALDEDRVRDYFDPTSIAEKWGRIAPVSTFALEDLTSSSSALMDFLNTMMPGVAPPGSMPLMPHKRPDGLRKEGIAGILLVNRFRASRYGKVGLKMRRYGRREAPVSRLAMKALPKGIAARPWNDRGLEDELLAQLAG